MPLFAFISSTFLSLVLIPVVRRLSFHYGMVAQPRLDRWHTKATGKLGGVGIFLAFFLSLIIILVFLAPNGRLDGFEHGGLLACAAMAFGLGLYDDIKQISPPAKLVGQVIIAAVAVFFGYSTQFFAPRVDNILLAQILNTLLTIIWLVGITNAINLLDNMDGLAGGIAFIIAAVLGFFFYRDSNLGFLLIVCSLAGSVLGFLRYNFPPASIFMGDSGSQFLGFMLAVLAIAWQPQASGVLAIVAVPTLIFLLPIADTALVTLTRLLRGESPTKGGRDHTSHRLIAFGLSERQTVLFLYGIALISGVASILIEAVGYWLSILVVPFLIIALLLLAAYLSGVKLDPAYAPVQSDRKIAAQVMLEFAYKRRLLEVALDIVLIALAYYLSVWIHKAAILDAVEVQQFLRTLPIILAATFLVFYVFGVYRGVWRYVGLNDLLRYLTASLAAALLNGAIVYYLYPGYFSVVVFALFAILLFFGVAITRSSFRLLDTISQRTFERIADERVLIFGANGIGEITMRWILMNPALNYRLVGFLDEDPLLIGRQIGGVRVLGGIRQMDGILSKYQVDGVIITRGITLGGNMRVDTVDMGGDQQSDLVSEAVEDADLELSREIIGICAQHNCWVRSLRLDFELIER